MGSSIGGRRWTARRGDCYWIRTKRIKGRICGKSEVKQWDILHVKTSRCELCSFTSSLSFMLSAKFDICKNAQILYNLRIYSNKQKIVNFQSVVGLIWPSVLKGVEGGSLYEYCTSGYVRVHVKPYCEPSPLMHVNVTWRAIWILWPWINNFRESLLSLGWWPLDKIAFNILQFLHYFITTSSLLRLLYLVLGYHSCPWELAHLCSNAATLNIYLKFDEK